MHGKQQEAEREQQLGGLLVEGRDEAEAQAVGADPALRREIEDQIEQGDGQEAAEQRSPRGRSQRASSRKRAGLRSGTSAQARPPKSPTAM